MITLLVNPVAGGGKAKNVVDEVYTVNGGGGLFGAFQKKISLEERTNIVRWATSVIEAL